MSFSLVLLGKLPPTCGQVSTLNLWLIAGLRDRGVNVTVCTDALFPQKSAVKSDLRSDQQSALDALLANVRVIYAAHLSTQAFLPFSELGYLSYLSAARLAVVEHQPDVIFSHYLEPYALVGAQLSQEFGIPHVVTHAGSDIARLCKTENVKEVYRAAFSRNCHFVGKTELARSIFKGIPSFSVNPYLPDPRHFFFTGDEQRNANKHDPMFGFYGKFVNGKNLDRLIAAFRVFRDRYGAGRLLLIGNDLGGSFRISDWVDSARDPSITICPFIPNWEVPALLNSLSCLIYTKAGYRVPQHAAIVMREAVACQVPVLATQESLDGSPFGLAKLGRIQTLSADADPSIMAEAMAEIVHNPPVVVAGREAYFAQGYTNYVDSWMDCLSRAIGGVQTLNRF